MAEPPEITPEDVEAFIRELPKIANWVETTVTEIRAYHSRIDGHQTELRSLSDAVVAMSGELQGLGQSVSRTLHTTLLPIFDDMVTQLREEQVKTRAEIMDRIDRLQGTVDLVREDSRVNWATANTAINRNLTSRDDIDGLLNTIQAMERRHQTLAAMVEELRQQIGKKPGA
jgi:hypothetical protein